MGGSASSGFVRAVALGLLLGSAVVALSPRSAAAFLLRVVDTDGAPVSGFRYVVELDNTTQRRPQAPSTTSIGLAIHKSHAPVVRAGHADGSSVLVRVPRRRRYFVSVLPDSGHTLGGTAVPARGAVATVKVHAQPVPTAQISVLAFVDQNPINNAHDPSEPGLGGALVIVKDAGGQMMTDVFGNPLGTIYDAGGAVVAMGSGTIRTLTQDEFDHGPNPYGLRPGEALVKNLAPGKYGVTVIPPNIDAAGLEMQWVQTTTIEGTPTIDAWVKANEPAVFVEGFGTGFKHVVFGFVKSAPASSAYRGQTFEVPPWNAAPLLAETGSISGRLRWNHFAKPPFNQGFFPGEPVPECWVGLVDPQAQTGLYAAPCGDEGVFHIPNVPAGVYQIVWWDKPLDALFGAAGVTVGDGEAVDLGEVLAFRWFGTFEGTVFYDADGDGFRDAGEAGIPEQNVNIRFRDGSIYQSQPTDGEGGYSLSEVFPFFKWLVPEVDFARFKATGITVAVDDGGQIPPANGWLVPSFDKLNPQPQATVNPNTGNRLSRTERGPVLTQAMHLFLNQTNVIDWGKAEYAPGENGGISGVVFYDTTRAEDEAVNAAPEPWQPGIPDVQVNLYRDDFDNLTRLPVPDGKIDDVNGDGRVQLADVDNPPFGWARGGRRGPEDVDRNRNGRFNTGDAVAITYTDSWDRDPPTGCIQNLPLIHGRLAGRCADNYSTWNQVRPGVFDGGYAFDAYVPTGLSSRRRAVSPLGPGTYIVEVAPPPGYELVKEEDKNVDFGDEPVASLLLLPPDCVGDPHTVPPELSLFPGVAPALAGEVRPLCDRKQVRVADGKNAAADFFLFTYVPKAARAVGFVNNDLSAEFNMASPNFGEKLSPSWLPVSFRDWTGHEITRVYSDEFGSYNTLLPSTFTMNVPAPSGVSPNMVTLVLNDPFLPDGSQDPFYNPNYSVTPWTFHYFPGTTSYLDTPLVPTAAFVSYGGSVDTDGPSGTPAIASVHGPEAGGGPLLCSARASGSTLAIRSVGRKTIINPDYNPSLRGSPYRITRDYGFGTVPGEVTVGGQSLALPLAIESWTDAEIRVSVPAGVTDTGRLMVTRGDNGASTEVGVTLHQVDCATTQVVRVPGDFGSIQAAIDDAGTLPGALVLVGEGSYRENVILYKPLRLQGAGAGSTFINADPNPMERLAAWHAKLDALGGAAVENFVGPNIFTENEAPAVFVVGETAVNGDTFNLGFPFDTPGQALVDGFTLLGSKAGGGLAAFSGVRDLVVSNLVVTNNQGWFAGGVSVGVPDTPWDGQNARITVRDSKIHRNGGVQGPGGIAMNNFSRDYRIEGNIIAGNLSRGNGGGIGHIGFSPGDNVIRGNRILYNEDAFGAVVPNAGDGAGIYVGALLAGSDGTGSVTIDRNLIQGNLAASGRGGGIRVFAMSGTDVSDNPGDDTLWHRLLVTNNIIANNVAGLEGGGISLQDVVRSRIENNTIVNNDATATAALAFTAGQLNSNPQPAGVVAHAHSAALTPLLPLGETGYADPVLVDNIVRHNRSFFNDASLNGGAGGLEPNPTMPYWDLQVLETATPAYLAPANCVLTSLTDPTGADYTGSGNQAVDPRFVREVVNQLETATVIDEGGNSISVRFRPLLPTMADYHLRPGSPAIDAGQDTGVTPDFDGDARPEGGAFDIGADEHVAATYDAVTVLSPNGGERLPAGLVFPIYWGAPAAADHFTVRVSYNGGRSWSTLATGVTGPGLDWAVPTPRRNNERVLIRVQAFDAADLPVGADRSDRPFAIEVVRLVHPDGGQVFAGGTQQLVRWTTNGTALTPVDRVLLHLSTNGGASWSLVADLPGNPGSLLWTVPALGGLRNRCLMRVRLRSGAATVGIDRSDRVFAIRPPLLP